MSELSTNDNTKSDINKNYVRITFLVNIWLNYHPAAITPLPVDIVDFLNSTTDTSLNNPLSHKIQFHDSNMRNNESSVSCVDISSKHCSKLILDGSLRYPLTTVNITKQLTGQREKRTDNDNKQHQIIPSPEVLGEWTSVPFISENSEWGKSDGDSELSLSMWLPLNILNILNIPPSSALNSITNRNKRNMGNDEVVGSHNSGENTQIVRNSNTFQINYKDDQSFARLEYDGEESEEDSSDNEVEN